MSVVETAMRIHGAMTGSGGPIGEDEREALVGWLRWRIEVAWEPTIEQLTRERDEARANLAFASRMWDSPITSDWFDGVRNEAAHQVARWGTEHDAGKAPADWFGLLEYLGGKALHAATLGDVEKALHHTISAGACLMNWHRHLMDGQGLLRPGIEPPTGDIG